MYNTIHKFYIEYAIYINIYTFDNLCLMGSHFASSISWYIFVFNCVLAIHVLNFMVLLLLSVTELWSEFKKKFKRIVFAIFFL